MTDDTNSDVDARPRAVKTLAIDTSTKTQTLALTQGGIVVARRLSAVRTNHSETLLRNIDDMLDQAEWSVNDLQLVAGGLGPGTFTGLRVGLATAKSIARSAGAALVGVCSLAATARPIAALFDGTIFAVCDARRGEVYVASFAASDGAISELVAPRACRPETLRAEVAEASGPVMLVGNGLTAFEGLRTWDRPDVRAMPQPWAAPSSVSVALLAQQDFHRGEVADIASLEPNYVRPSDASLSAKGPQ